MAKKYDREALLADYHTGQYTQRELADKHKISAATVNSITRGLDKKTEQLVNKKVDIIQESNGLSEQELNAVERAVSFKSKLLADIERFSNKAINKASELLDASDAGSDFKAIVEGVDKLTVMTKINDRHAKPANVQQNTQNNNEKTITRVFHVVE